MKLIHDTHRNRSLQQWQVARYSTAHCISESAGAKRGARAGGVRNGIYDETTA